MAALALLLPGLGSCGLEFALAPCNLNLFSATRPGGNNFLDGTWRLTSVDGKLLPFTLPAGAGKLISGSIDFHTYSLDQGKCEDPKDSSGDIIAVYHLANASGVDQPPKAQAGSFKFNNSSNKVTLTALGQSAGATANPPSDVMDLTAPIPIGEAPFQLTITYRLHFAR